jgi:asparagine synthase (glutamine-hydrolysing)
MEGHLLNITRRLNPIVKESGVRVVMDGHGGDEVVSHGYGYPAELAQRREWKKLYREVGGEGERSSAELFLRYWLRYGPLPQRATRPVWWMLRRLGGGASASSARRALARQVIRPDFAHRTGLAERFQATRQAEQRAQESARHRHHWILTTPLQPAALEELERTAASFGLETRFPFWDQDLIAFCLSLPTRLKRQRGVGRHILRAATTGLMPDMVRTREDKTDFRKSVVAAMRAAQADAQAKWRAVSPSLAEWVDPSAFDVLLKRVSSNTMPAEEEGAALKMIGRLLQLGEWRYKL